MLIKNLYSRNVGLKFLSLFLAIVFWFMAIGRERAEVSFKVPLELIKIPENLVVASQIPDGISLRLSGSVNLTRLAATRTLRFSLDLSGAKVGPNHFTLLPEDLGLPRGLEVSRITPSTVSVELERLITREVTLLPVIRGEPVTGYMIEDIVLEPQKISIRGPESLVSKTDILWTEAIDVTALRESASLTTKPVLPDVSISLAQEAIIKAQLRIGQKMSENTFRDVPVEGINTDRNFKLIPETVDITVKGPLATMKALSIGKALHARVNLTDLDRGRHQRNVIVSLPPDMTVVKVEPQTIQVDIMEEPTGKTNDQKQPEIVRH